MGSDLFYGGFIFICDLEMARALSTSLDMKQI